MKVEIELPKLEIIMEEAKKKGFEIELPPIRLGSYMVKVKCQGHVKDAYVHENCHGKVAMDTGNWYWDREKYGRLRISAGKRVTVIGNKLDWMMDKMKNGRKKDEDEETADQVAQASTTLKFFK